MSTTPPPFHRVGRREASMTDDQAKADRDATKYKRVGRAASTYTDGEWKKRVDASNSVEQSRVSKKYPGTSKKISADPTKSGAADFTEQSDPFIGDDPIIDTMDVGRTHKLSQYAKAADLPQTKAKKILTESGTLQK